MTEKRVSINEIIESQIPDFLLQDSPTFTSFLKQYYKSLDFRGGAADLATNLKGYKNIEEFQLQNLIPYTALMSNLGVIDDTIVVASTLGWPDKNGLLKIDDEIIHYETKTATTFENCTRGFSATDSIKAANNAEFLSFRSTETDTHTAGTFVYNLSNLFLQEFFIKFKAEFLPGFENRKFTDGVDIQNILTRAKDFYRSKGTDTSYKILFKVLFGQDIELIKPQDFMIVPSDNNYFITKNVLLEKVSGGDPLLIKGNPLLQDISGIGTVSSSIYNIEYRPIDGKDFYEVSLDSADFSNLFEASGKTKLLEDVPAGSDTILVDSTVGFSNSGNVHIKPKGSNDYINVSYTGKTVNQFLGCSGVSAELEVNSSIVEDKFAYSYIGFGQTSRVDFLLTNVVDSIDFSQTSNLKVDDVISLSGFGKDLRDFREFNSWFYNIPTDHTIEKVSQVDSNKYRINLLDAIIFYVGEPVTLSDDQNNFSLGTIVDIVYPAASEIRKYTQEVVVQITSPNHTITDSVTLSKRISKGDHYINTYNYISKIPTGVQNTYITADEKNFYVASTGLPNYQIFAQDTRKELSVSGINTTEVIQSTNHGFYDGENVYFIPTDATSVGVDTGFYFISSINKDTLSLSFSKADSFGNKHVSVTPNGGVVGTLYRASYENKTIQNQKLFKKFGLEKQKTFFDDKNRRSTDNRYIGMLGNGVEILSPTLFDENVYYGRLTDIEVTNSGQDYDVINPPELEIVDSQGSGCKAHVNLSGSVQEIKVLKAGVGYATKPEISITGGNGTGCVLESNLVKTRTVLQFKPTQPGIDIAANTINFGENHNFQVGEEVIYNSNKNTDIGGLVGDSHYYVSTPTTQIVKLHSTPQDAVAGINAIDITAVSTGFHAIESLTVKNTISTIYVKEQGQGYSNRAIKIPSANTIGNKAGINTYDSYIYARSHGFNEGEVVHYSTSDTVISGMNTTSDYYINVIDSNKFRVAVAGTIIASENYDHKKFVKFDNIGVGTHTFAYPKITISINTTSEQGDIDIVVPELEPKILGSIDDVFVEDGGVSYGCTSQFNYHRRPEVRTTKVSSKALLAPIIVGGTIVDVKIINKGHGYRLDSDIIVSGEGSFADLVPVVESGKITSVKVLNGGVGYNNDNTTLSVEARGKNAKFLGNVTNWKVNQVEKLKNQISDEDDGFLLPSRNETLGLEFVNFFIPKKLRYQLGDNFTQNNVESPNTKVHSPIVGFAYDGNPIYGPYGYQNILGGGIKQIKTGYEISVDNTPGVRPTSPEFTAGFFINDYIFTGTGDLDENNGRYCKTPEYPDGTYAYFVSQNTDNSGKSQPTYPYFIGPYFHSQPIEENFLPSINQDIDIAAHGLTRNVSQYYITSNNSKYKPIDKVDEKFKQEFRVSEIKTSGIKDTSVFSPGDGYKVGDSLVIKNRGESGSGANIAVSKIKGKTVSSFSVNETVTSGVVFDLKKSNTIECRLTDPHEILNNEIINISGISTTSAKSVEGDRLVTVRNKTTKLTSNMVSATGVTTTIYVNDISGFRVEDMIGIGTEICRIIRIDKNNSAFDINRLQYPGIHTAFSDDHLITLKPTVFDITINSDQVPDDYVYTNEVIYFDPKVTVGTGTTGSVREVLGVGGTIVEYRTVPKSSIFIPSHKFYTGQELKYHIGLAGTSLYINNVGSGSSIVLENGQTVYAVNLGKDHVGLSTVGFTSTTGIGTQLNAAEFVNFDSLFPTIGAAHSLSTINKEITGTIERYSATVGTSETHGLTAGDRITFSINNREKDPISVFYNPVIRKMTTGPVSFGASEVSSSEDTIDLTGQVIEQGEKVVYSSANPADGLENNKCYFVFKTDKNKIKLTEYLSDIDKGKTIDILTSGGTGQKLHRVNPALRFIKNDTINFDLSDPSISEMDLEFYEDPDFTRRLELVGTAEDGFAITRTGTPGNADAKVEIDTSSSQIPSAFYYTLVPKGPTDVRKTEISRDLKVVGANKVDIVPHSLNTDYNVNISDESTFLFNLLRRPSVAEKTSYNSSNTTVSYVTESKTANGPIEKLRINFAGVGYDRLPLIETIKSDKGKNANIKLISDDIGKVEKYERVKDGFDYPTDPTLSPLLSTPSVVGVKDIRTIDYIGITTGGKGYNQTPTLIVPAKPSIKLIPTLEGGSITKVDVAQNAIDFSDPLDIVTIHHSQGYDIDFFTVNGSLITAELSNADILTSGVSSSFPFDVGDEVFVEGCRLTADSDHLANYNSDAYDYKFFKVTGISTTNNTVTYNMTGISTGTFGVYDDGITLGYLVNKKQVPQFEMVLKDDVSYLSKEKVTGPTFSGIAMEGGWDNDLNQLRIGKSFGQLRVNDKLTGESSKVIGTVEYFSIFNLSSTLGISRDKVGQLDKSVGILNDFQQRISDNFYYQKFSYSVKSQLSYDKWKEPVRSLVHPSGFKEFSDLEFITQPTPEEVSVGIAKSDDLKPTVVDSTSSLLVNIDQKVSFSDRTGFNMVYEEDLLPDGSTQKIYMDGGIPIKSFILSKTNKVIKIDNIDDQFNGSSKQELDGTYADASDLLDLNRQFLIDEVHATTIYNYPSLTSDPLYDEEEFKAKTGRVVDAVSSDLKYNANSHTVSVASSYWSAGNSVGVNTIQTIYGYNYLRFLGQYVVNNQTPPTFYQSGTTQQFNLSVLQDPANDYFVLNHDARDLIVENKREILDKALASVAVPYPTFIIPGSTANEEQNRYAIGYKLTKENQVQIVNESFTASVAQYTGISTLETKAKTALNKFVDAVATDLFTGGNRYCRQEALSYFNGPMPANDRLIIGAEETNYLFDQAKSRIRKAVRNGMGVTYAASEGPPIYGVGTTVSNTAVDACQDVQNTVITLSALVTGPIGVATLSSLPAENVGTYSTGVAKCFRDLKYIVDGVAQDIAYDTNQHTVRNTKFYFDAQGNQKTDGLVYEEAESIYIFRSAMDYMKKAVRNELYYIDDTIVPLNQPGVGASAYTANIQTDIESLVGILTVAIGNSSLSSIPSVGFGTGDCANVRYSLRNYVGIVTNIIGIGTDQTPSIITSPSLTKGGIIVGLSSFKLTSDGQPLFKKTFNSSSSTVIDIVNDKFTFQNHNFQSGQELIYNPLGGTRIGVATTSYTTGQKDIIMEVDNLSGSGVKNNGIGQPIAVTGVATVLVPPGPTTQLFNDVVGTGATNGEAVVIDVIVTYSAGNGVALSTTGSLVQAGKNFGVGEVVTIGGTYFGGTSPANDYTFTVTSVGPTGIQTEANNTYTSVPGSSTVGSGASFTISRNNTGQILGATVTQGGSGYASTSVITVSGTNIGGVTPGDDITFSPSVLGGNTLPNSVFLLKESDSEFKLSGLSTSLPFDITSVGVGTATFELKNPNPSTSIAIDGIVQNQLRRKNLQITLGSAVGLTTDLIQVSVGINSIVTGDIINANNEYILIKSVGVAGTDVLEVQREYLGTVGAAYTVGVAATIVTGDYNIVGDTIFFTTPPYGKIGPVGLETGSTFNGRAFSRRFDPDKTEDQNVVFDDISLAFTGIAATEFTLKVNDATTTAAFNDVNKGTDINNNPFVFINNVFQRPRKDFTVDGSTENVLRFLSGTPSAGRISKVAITTGFGYVSPVGAAGSIQVDANGGISTITVEGAGRGYQFPPKVSIASSLGYGATITANLGAGGTITHFTLTGIGTDYTNNSNVIITPPTGYSNMDLHYAGVSTGIGIEATAKIKIGVGSSVTDFEIDDHGRAYRVGDVLKVPGLIQDSALSGSFEEFQITVEEVQTDKFAGFYPGQFILFDDFSSQFNGFRKKFTLTVTENGVTDILSLRKLEGSDLVLENNLFIYVNDILQAPRKSYKFRGSRVIFTEAPKPNSTCTVMFYRGSSLDVETVNPPASLKEGDGVIIAENREDPLDRDQFERVIKKIQASDEFDTFTYASVGIDTNPDNVRPLTWKKQEFDRIINGSIISKSRPGLSGKIIPNARVINDINTGDSEIYVDNAFPIFSELDTIDEDDRNIFIVEDRTTEVAIATAVVSTASTISEIVLSNGGVGYAYTNNPVINISSTAIGAKDPINDWKTTSGLTTDGYTFKDVEKGSVAIAVGTSSRYAFSAGSDVWFDNTLGFGNTITFNAVGFAGTNIYMTVGEYGYVTRGIGYGQSIDSTWTPMNLREDRFEPATGQVNTEQSTYGENGQQFNDVVYSPYLDVWSMVGTAGSIFVGPGIGTTVFTSVTSNSIQSINSVAASPEGLIAVGNNNTIRVSANGQGWTSISIAGVGGQNLNKVIYRNGTYAICGSNGTIIGGDSLSNLTKKSTNVSVNFVTIDFEDIFVAIDDGGNVYYSYDLEVWILREISELGSNTPNALMFVNEYGKDGRYVVVGSGSTIIVADQVFNRATATTSQTAGIVTSITITNGGFGYSQENPPAVLIESPSIKKERVDSIKAVGDFGAIIGVTTFPAGTPGIGTTSPKIEFILKSETYDNTALGIGYSSLNTFGVSYSQLSKGDYFVIQNSNVAIGRTLVGITTLDGLNGMANYPDSVVGIMRTEQKFIDGVYRVEQVTTAQAGIVTVTCNFQSNDASVAGESIQVYQRGADVSGVNTNGFYGNYSWGKIYDFRNRVLGSPKSFTVDRDQGIVGLETAPVIYRTRSI